MRERERDSVRVRETPQSRAGGSIGLIQRACTTLTAAYLLREIRRRQNQEVCAADPRERSGGIAARKIIETTMTDCGTGRFPETDMIGYPETAENRARIFLVPGIATVRSTKLFY